MDYDSDRLVLWPGYFDLRLSRGEGRRVPKDSAVKEPDLDGLAWASKQAGVRKMKRDTGPSHPKRPYRKEGRLWVSASAARKDVGASNKEELMQIIGGVWREHQAKLVEQEHSETSTRSKAGSGRSRPRRNKSQAAQQAARRAQKARQSRSKKRRKR